MGTDALDDIVSGGHVETIGDVNRRNGCLLKAIGAMALLAEEMHMEVVILMVTMAVAEFIAHAVAAVLYDVHQMMLTEEGECTKHARLIDG
jgi:hypothetical protein